MPLMSEEINYLDLIILRKIDAESTIEKFGTQINTSYFETANLLGTMKIKGLIDIQTSIGGQSPIVITGDGRDLLSEAVKKAAEPPDTLDQAILHALAGGASDLPSLQQAINIRSRDLAFHLHKLKTGDLIDYEARSAKVRLFLTEKGFNQTGGVRSTVFPPGQKGAPSGASPASGPTGVSTSLGATASVAGKPISKPASGASAPILVDSEISDILNFGGWNKPKAPPGTVGSPASSKPSSMGMLGTGAKLSSAPALQSTPGPAPSAGPASGSPDAPARLDRTAMLFSKLEYYVRHYALYAIMVLVLLALIAYAIFFAAGPRPGA